MKKLLIFLMLFAFGFGAYCVNVLEKTVTVGPGDCTRYVTGTGYIQYYKTYTLSESCEYFFVVTASSPDYGAMKVYNVFNQIYPPTLTYSQHITVPAGSYEIAISMDPSFSTSMSLKIYKVINGNPPVITSLTSLTETAGTAFSYEITAIGDPTITYSINPEHPLPAYLSLSGSTISGTLPFASTAYGFYFHVIATNPFGDNEKEILVAVLAAGLPVWDNPINITKNVGDTLSVNVSPEWVAGAPVIDVSVGSGSLPSFLELSTSDVLSGTCTTAGIYNFNLSATNPYGTANRDIKLTVTGNAPNYIGPIPPVINLTRGLQFAFDLGASMWTGADTVTMSGLPVWASVSNNMLSGVVPSDEIRQNITGMVMTAVNSTGNSVQPGFEFNITGIGDSLYFTSPSTAQGTINQPFTYNSTVNQPSGVSYSMSNAPDWLSCSSSGSVTGTVPEGITGFSFVVTATHAELGSKSLTVNCTAVISGEENTNSQHVIVDNFEDFGTTQWATDMKGFLANSYQEFSHIKLGVNAISNKMEITNTKLDGVRVGTDGINNKLDITNGNLFVINDTLETIDNDIISGFDEVSDLLTDIRSKLNDSPSISSDGLDLPSYEFDTDFGDFTTSYTSSEITSKTKIAQFDFVTGKLSNLLAVQSSDLILELPLANTGLGFTENPSLNVTSNPVTAPYASTVRMFFSIIVYIVGCCWWLTIIMGFFV